MADKSFGVKELNLISASGTPTITSPNSVNINATNVAISTDITVGGMVSLGAGTSISSPGTNVLTFGTNSTEKVRIESDGQVVINRSSGAILADSSSKLEVYNSTENLIFVSNSTAASGQDAGIMFGPANNVYGGKIIVTSDEDFSTSANRTAHMAFYTRKDGTASEKLRITSDGDLLLSGLTSKNDDRNAKGITLKSASGISFQNFGSNGSRNWRIRPDDLTSWGSLEFSVSPTDNDNTDWPDAAGDVVLELQKDKDVVVSNGNLVIGTNGKGIDFSATTDGPNVSSELLDDYEEGTFEPTFRGASGVFNTVAYHTDTGGRYTKVGNLVMVTGCVRIAGGTLDKSNISSTDTLCIGNLPFNNNARTNGDNADNHGTLRCPVWSGSNCPQFIQARQNVNYCNLYFISSLGGIHSTSSVSQLTNQSMVQFTLVYTSG